MDNNTFQTTQQTITFIAKKTNKETTTQNATKVHLVMHHQLHFMPATVAYRHQNMQNFDLGRI